MDAKGWEPPSPRKQTPFSGNDIGYVQSCACCLCQQRASGTTKSYCQQEGKDRIIFVTKEDHETPSSAELVADDPNDPCEEHGLMLPNGDINGNCPCLGQLVSGPCGEQFKSAFFCFHYSTENIKGSDCIDQFRAMQECMQKYQNHYLQDENEEEEAKPVDPVEETAGVSVAKEQGSSS
ncbi:mitochondrial intermembrane space import and assembly protein 40-like [Apodemus sylvaticus]|uniref:mitochondrial intermembrane space import and assembly protein 40-like n=1 Tax=Apodemus sylvaticus TaxID=10129 RepID=UPI002243B51C|nr:mitochondrial intermembrane space import and assembly protein 40-like [Apodemus sylvaticus]